MRMQFFFLGLLPFFLLFACDKGRAPLEKLDADFKEILEKPLSLENIKTAQMASIGYLYLSGANDGAPSAKLASERILKIKEKATVFHAEGNSLLQLQYKELDPLQKEAKEIAEKMATQVKAASKRSILVKNPAIKEGNCIARNTVDEFNKLPSLFTVSVFRIEKLGKENALLKQLYAEKGVDALTENWLSEVEAKPAVSENLLFLETAAKVECSEAKRLQKAFQSGAPVVAKIKDIIEAMNIAKTLSALN